MFERVRRLATVVTDADSFGARVLDSGIWASLSNGVGRGLQMGKLLALTWLVSTSEFGLASYALLTLAAVRRVSSLGIDSALIEKAASDVDEYFDIAWTLRAVRGFVLAGVLFVAAPGVAAFFGAPDATGLVRTIGFVPLVRGLKNPGIVYFRKELDFRREFVYRVGRVVVIVVVTLAIAVVTHSAWAIVLGNVAGAFGAVAISYFIHDYRPWFALDRERTRDLLGYGKWITLSGALVFLVNEGDDVFVGWFLGAGALGVYTVAYRFSNAPATEVTNVVSTVAFPAYSKLQSDTAALRDAFYKAVTLTTLFAFPVAVGIVVVAPVFVETFLRDEWATPRTVHLLQLLAIWGLLRSYGAATGPLFRAVGRPDYETKIQFGKLIIIAALIYPAAQWAGVIGVAGVVVLNSVVLSEPLATVLAVRTVDGRFRAFLPRLGYPAAASLLMGGLVYAARAAFDLDGGVLAFLALVAVGTATYPVFVLAFDRWLGYDIVALARSLVDLK